MQKTKPSRYTVVVLAVIAGMGSVAGPARADVRPGPCHLHRAEDETIQHFSKRVIRCAADRWTIPGGADKAICIARRESGLDPSATSSGGDFLGLFQHMASDWPRRYSSWTKQSWELGTSALNGRTNTVVTIRIVDAVGWGAWAGPGC